MIISRTPLRVSFAGGGSDLASYYRRFGGAVLSTAIDQFVYLTVSKKFDDSIRVSYSRTEEVVNLEDVQHPLVRNAMKLTGTDSGVEITSVADIPASGTGLGSSSSFTVGLLHALYAHSGRYVPAERLAVEACSIEIDHCGEPIGKQDQYAAAYGGLNFIRFQSDDTVCVDPILCRKETVASLQNQLLFFYTGITRSASAILKKQGEVLANASDKQATMKRMVELAYELKHQLEENRPDALGPLLHESWMLKRAVSSGITTGEIDAWYNAALEAGALGGKILGAGSGGFLMFAAPPDRHYAIRTALAALREVSFRFESQGSKIIFVH